MTNPALRIAIVTDDWGGLAPWELRLYDKIAADPRFVICGLAVDRAPAPNPPGLAVHRLLAAVESRAFVRVPPYEAKAFERVRAETAVVDLGPDGEPLAGLAPDVVLWHAASRPSGGLARTARHGVWLLEPFGAGPGRHALAGVRACLDRTPVTSARLVELSAACPQGAVIAEAAFNADLVPARNLAHAAEKAVALVFRELCRRASGRTCESNVSALSGTRPANLEDAGLALGLARAARLGASLAGSLHDRFSRRAGRLQNRWSLYFGKGDLETADLRTFVEAPTAPGEFWADPFLIEHRGETWVLFENYVYAEGKAKISVGRWLGDRLDVLGDALVRPYHLSFPFVFTHQGELYMVPETSGARRVEVWRAVDFPLRWECFATALEGSEPADTVLFENEGRWWMATNLSEGPVQDQCNELHLYAIDGPGLDCVEPHPLNPVVIDSRTARNAGRIVRRHGRLIRPSQCNSDGIYGRGLNLMEITRLDRDGYEERLLRHVTPDFKPGLVGCHHIDSAGGLLVVDACRRWG